MAVALALNFIDVIYFRFTQKRMTIDVFDYVKENNNEIVSLIPVFIRDFWLPFVVWIFFIWIMVCASRKIKVDYRLKNRYNLKNYIFDTVKFIFIFLLSVIISRGGIQNKPINIINAGEYTEPEFFPLLLNTPFTIIKTKDETGISQVKYFESEEYLDCIFTPVHSFQKDTDDFKNLNVVILILESFTAEHSGFLNPEIENGKYKGYTPFLDSLMEHSLVFKGYANGEKSIDGIPAIISGIPSLMNSPYLLSPYAGNSINSMAGLLKEKGYSTSFYHGGTNGTMGFYAYTKIAGFDNYFGRYEYDNDLHFDGKWGIFDEEFLQYAAKNLDQMKNPFLSVIFTLSSHHPFTIPEKYKGRFPKGTMNIHESIGYSDYSLKRFFDTVSRMDWFDNTLFVLTADHTYEGYFPPYTTSAGKYSIPIVFYIRGADWEEKEDLIVQQTDILPSVLDYLNYDKDFIAFGNSVFDSTASHYAVSYLFGIYQLIQNEYLLKFDGEKDIALYNLKNDITLKDNLLGKEDSVQQKMNLMVKAIKQQYDSRMINNQLTIKR
jgi:phosphoglycerol transferase MdoB-like AlkP superfamily enzyme